MHGQAHWQRIEPGCACEQLRLFLHSLKFGEGNARAPVLSDHVLHIDAHQAIRIRVWQRPEQHGIDHRKQRGVGADTQRQSKDRDKSESCILAQYADSEANVLPESFHADSWTRPSTWREQTA